MIPIVSCNSNTVFNTALFDKKVSYSSLGLHTILMDYEVIILQYPHIPRATQGNVARFVNHSVS